jgi:hypothetical protein
VADQADRTEKESQQCTAVKLLSFSSIFQMVAAKINTIPFNESNVGIIKKIPKYLHMQADSQQSSHTLSYTSINKTEKGLQFPYTLLMSSYSVQLLNAFMWYNVAVFTDLSIKNTTLDGDIKHGTTNFKFL